MSDEVPKDAYILSNTLRRRIFKEQIVPEEYGELKSTSKPTACFVGAQPGAGKSRIQKQLHIRLENPLDQGTLMEVVGDDLRNYHPKHQKLLRKDDQHAAYFTDIDSGKWVQMAIKLSAKARVNAIVEGTLRNPQVTQESARLYKRSGFQTELHVLLVHEYQSRLYIVGRYLAQVADKGHGRYTVKSAHDVAYNALPGSLIKLAESNAFDQIVLYDEKLTQHIFLPPYTKSTLEKMSTAVKKVRESSNLPTSDLLKIIESYLRLAKKYKKEECYKDTLTIKTDIQTQGAQPL